MNDLTRISIISFFIMVFIVGCSDPTIEVRKQVEKGVRLPEKVQIKLTNDEDSSIDANGNMAMSWYVNEAINAIGIKEYYDGKADTILECTYKYGLCLPYFGRHFDIHFNAISDVNIKILNPRGTVLAEAQYVGSWNRMPTLELISKMIGLMIQTEIHILNSSINKKDINSVVVKYANKN